MLARRGPWRTSRPASSSGRSPRGRPPGARTGSTHRARTVPGSWHPAGRAACRGWPSASQGRRRPCADGPGVREGAQRRCIIDPARRHRVLGRAGTLGAINRHLLKASFQQIDWQPVRARLPAACPKADQRTTRPPAPSSRYPPFGMPRTRIVLVPATAHKEQFPHAKLSMWRGYQGVLPTRVPDGSPRRCRFVRGVAPSQATECGSPKRGRVAPSKRVMAQIWVPARVRTISPTV